MMILIMVGVENIVKYFFTKGLLFFESTYVTN